MLFLTQCIAVMKILLVVVCFITISSAFPVSEDNHRVERSASDEMGRYYGGVGYMQYPQYYPSYRYPSYRYPVYPPQQPPQNQPDIFTMLLPFLLANLTPAAATTATATAGAATPTAGTGAGVG
ncbi:unnamed protein product [Gadus morhua 'NCC']